MTNLSWKLVEKPFRDRQNFNSATIAKASKISIIYFLYAGISGYLMDGFASRFEHNKLTNTAVSFHLREKCLTDGINYLPPNQTCRYYGEDTTWATLGDNHVAEMSLCFGRTITTFGGGFIAAQFFKLSASV